jgi:cytochrome c oxidase assembly factor CtaG/ferredoxin
MSPILDAVLRSWPWDPWFLGSLCFAAFVYLRGWRVLARRHPVHWPIRKPIAFLSGLLALFLALASPIEPFANFLLQIHMVQHLLLMMIAPPLLWLGAPFFPLLMGLPRLIRVFWISPFLRSPFLRKFFERLTEPPIALVLFIATTWIWHIPFLYDLAMRSDNWHYLQHVCFFVVGLLFWHPVVRPYPSRPRWSPWILVPYLILADVQNTALSALFTFANQVMYSHYEQVPRLGNYSALDDQAAAGVLMWVPGSLVFLLPLFLIGLRQLFGSASKKGPDTFIGRLSLPLVGAAPHKKPFDLLRVPLVGRFLRWRHSRLAMQIPLLLLGLVVIYDGFHGPDVGPMNLAGVLPWIHWRGLLILGLLVMGNVFCMGCPLLAARSLTRRWLPHAGFLWPPWLRNKWLAIALVVLFLWAYEAFSLWDSPWLTAWIAVAYFVAAFAIDSLFRGAAFCKYVCPIGQFNFVQSLVSPLEVKARDPAVCETCQTKDCLRGRGNLPGCELHLFVRRKSSNMDCTLCLDCIHACPHDNIGLIAGVPGAELTRDPHRSGVGRFGNRFDLAALVLIMVFGAFANAAGMVAPVVDWQERWAKFGRLGFVTVFYLFALLLAPLAMVGTAALLSRWWGELSLSWVAIAKRFSYSLVPLGFGMWLTHYSFHFFTSYETIIPTTQRFFADLGWVGLGVPAWACSCCRPITQGILQIELLFLDLGLLLSLYTAYRLALDGTAVTIQSLRAFAPWAVLQVLLFALGVWIVFQPMQMRGAMPG